MNPAHGTAPIDGHTHLLRLASEAVRKGDLAAEQFVRMLTVEVGQTPSTVVYEENALELHRYEPDELRHETPIFAVYALVNRPYILDLQPDRSVIRRLLEAGFRVYLLDWGEPSRLDAHLGMADYVCRYLDNCVDVALADADVEDLHVLGYCMGGTMSLMYASQTQDPIRTLTCMATPVSLDGNGGILEHWAQHFDPSQAVDALGNIPGELLAWEFSMMDPVDQYVTKYVRLFENFEDDDFVENFARMERWIWDSVDVAGRAFREFVDDVYRQDQLSAGKFTLDGNVVDLATIDVPLCQVVGQHDHIVPPESSKPLSDLVGSDDQRLFEFPAGHIGISVSSSAHERLWPGVTDWLAERSDSVAEPAPAGPQTVPDDADDRVADDERDEARRTVEAVARRAAGKVATDRVGSTVDAAATDSGGEPRNAEEPIMTGDEIVSQGSTASGEAAVADDGDRARRTVDAVARRAAGKVATQRVGNALRGETDDPSADADLSDAGDEPAPVERSDSTPDDRPVESIDGIGPTYAERLATAEITTVADLRSHTVPVLAAITDAPRARVADWLAEVE